MSLCQWRQNHQHHKPLFLLSPLCCHGNQHPQPAPEESGSFHAAHWVLIPFLFPSPEGSALAMGLPGMVGKPLLGCHSNVPVGPTGQGQGTVWIVAQALDLRAASGARVERLGTAPMMGHMELESSCPLQPLLQLSAHRTRPRNPAWEAQPSPRPHAGAGPPVTTGRMHCGSRE